MRLDQVLVTLLGFLGIAWVYRYFFRTHHRTAVATLAAGGTQIITIAVDGGYAPSVVEVQVGRPVRLRFDRKDSDSCTEEVVLPDFGIRRFLPTGAITDVEFTPREPGSFEFACGMGMIRGRLNVHQ
jgi:plastocyanin domain-containing protein